MGDSNVDDDDDVDGVGQKYTTNPHDQQAAADLQARLAKSGDVVDGSNSSNNTYGDGDDEDHNSIPPSVSIDDGAHKYVLITATSPAPSSSSSSSSSSNHARTFVYSRRNAKYHVNVAEEIVPQLENHGYRNIRVAGGGRILRNDTEKKIHIFGYSYGFGKADHAVAKEAVEKSVHYRGYEVTW